MRDLIGAVPGVDTDLLRIPVHLIDLATIPEDQLRGGPIVVALLWALKAASAGLLADRIEPIMETAGKADRDFRFRARIEALTRYAIAVCRHKNKLDIISRGLARVFGKKEADTMSMTIAEELMMEGEARGVAKGKAEGIVEGRAKGIVSVLEIRFGPLAEERKTSIMSYRDLTRLDSLTALAVTCPDVDAFFAALA